MGGSGDAGGELGGQALEPAAKARDEFIGLRVGQCQRGRERSHDFAVGAADDQSLLPAAGVEQRTDDQRMLKRSARSLIRVEFDAAHEPDATDVPNQRMVAQPPLELAQQIVATG